MKQSTIFPFGIVKKASTEGMCVTLVRIETFLLMMFVRIFEVNHSTFYSIIPSVTDFERDGISKHCEERRKC